MAAISCALPRPAPLAGSVSSVVLPSAPISATFAFAVELPRCGVGLVGDPGGVEAGHGRDVDEAVLFAEQRGFERDLLVEGFDEVHEHGRAGDDAAGLLRGRRARGGATAGEPQFAAVGLRRQQLGAFGGHALVGIGQEARCR